jgi:dihydrofolate synthase/folylpolyglutamate synthase
VAGTSGKGSTCFLLSQILESQNFKVGLHLSPHLLDIRERFQINNKLLTEKKVCQYLNEILPKIEKMNKSTFGQASYFEILVGLAFYIFQKEKVDYAIIETGMGGLYDATNIVKSKEKVSLITKIGLDHIKILGNTYQKIAYQKGMIINNDSINFSESQRDNAKNELIKIAKIKSSQLTFVKNNQDYQINSENGFNFNNHNFKLGLIGKHQIENCTLALKCFVYLSQRDQFKINWEKINESLRKAKFIGRGQIEIINNKKIIIDGAHNPQKMNSLLKIIKKEFKNKSIDFILGFKSGKDYKMMLKKIVKVANKIYVTSFFTKNQDLFHLSVQPKLIAKSLRELNFNKFEVIEDNQQIKNIVEKAQNHICLTGSLYLIGEVYPIIDDLKSRCLKEVDAKHF